MFEFRLVEITVLNGDLYKLNLFSQNKGDSKIKKTHPRSISCYFVGYREKSKCYRFYYPSHDNKIVKSIVV